MDDAPFMLTFNTYLNVMTFVTVPFVLCICYSDSEAKCKYYWSFVLCETGLSPNVLETTLYSVCRWYEQTNEPKQVLKSHEYDEQPLKNIYNLLSCSCHWNSFVYFVNYQEHLLFFVVFLAQMHLCLFFCLLFSHVAGCSENLLLCYEGFISNKKKNLNKVQRGEKLTACMQGCFVWCF